MSSIQHKLRSAREDKLNTQPNVTDLRFKEVTYGESLTDVVFDGLEGVLVRLLVLQAVRGEATPTVVDRLARGVGQDVDGHRRPLCALSLCVISLTKNRISGHYSKEF